jgi:Uma2 family endonuclease
LRLAAEGLFDNQRVERIDGEIIEMTAQNEPHIDMISRLLRLLIPQIPTTHQLRCQAGLTIGNSDPEPDFAIITLPKPAQGAPTTPPLVIEVADSSLALDRKKADLYASAAIPEYWIINLQSRQIERYTDPQPDLAAPFAASYTTLYRPTAKDVLAIAAIFPTALPVSAVFAAN